MSLKVMIRGRCGSHIMCPRTLPFPAPRIGNCTPGPWRSSRQAKPFSMSHLGTPNRPRCSRRDAARQSAVGDGPRHLRGNPWSETTSRIVLGSSLAPLLPSWSDPRKVRRRTHEFPRELPVTMNRGQKTTPNSFQTAHGSSLASPLPSWSSRKCLQLVSRRAQKFSSTSSHSSNCSAQYPRPIMASTTAAFLVNSGKDFSNSTRSVVDTTQHLQNRLDRVRKGRNFKGKFEIISSTSSLDSRPGEITQERIARSPTRRNLDFSMKRSTKSNTPSS